MKPITGIIIRTKKLLLDISPRMLIFPFHFVWGEVSVVHCLLCKTSWSANLQFSVSTSDPLERAHWDYCVLCYYYVCYHIWLFTWTQAVNWEFRILLGNQNPELYSMCIFTSWDAQSLNTSGQKLKKPTQKRSSEPSFHNKKIKRDL